ncbi:unnamed protein product [Brachionus calyciflorus]|uniref:G-protein coupled receptors family 1 profile domain-containing protein n=1 Tax=Brachionus calyciflorus TaxID=104777 RepID=A0A814QBD0_9BILA|nr:unnamed protein product [Brachionus calyciflorus]
MYVSDYWKQFGVIEFKWHYLNAFVYGSIGLLSLITNSMVLFYILRIKKKTNRTNGIIFLINLAIADIFKVMINLPMTAISSFYGKWIFEQKGIFEISI